MGIGDDEKRIHLMMDCAKQDGYFDDGEWTEDDIIADLMAFAELNDNEGEEFLRPHVKTWMAKQAELPSP